MVQRHRARALHYDLRLEMGGVLASWAVPKGPTLDPKARRLAVHVEDHPLDYFDFEGVIPSGEYGGGDVIVWDWGTWSQGKEGQDDPVQAVEDGEIHFDLHGEKLHGRFVLVRTDRKGGDKQWMLLHKKDDHSVARLGRGRPPRVGEVGPHQRRGEGGAAGHLDPGRAARDPPTDDELAALDELAKAGEWELQGRDAEAHQPRQGAVPGQATARTR